MVKKEKEILEEVINSLKTLQARVDVLEKEVAGLKGLAEPVSDGNEAIDIDIDDLEIEPVDLTEDLSVKAGEPAAASVEEEVVEEEVVEEVVEEVYTESQPVTSSFEEDYVILEDETDEDATAGPAAEPAPAVEPAPTVEPALAAESEPVAEPAPAVEPAPAAEPVLEEKASEEPELVEGALFGDDMSLFGALEEPVKKHKSHKTLNETTHSNKAVIDVMAEKLAWKYDMPGTEVKDIKSAISLNDRVLFISSLFREDSMLYQDTMSKLNAMASLEEAIQYLKETFPEWNLESDSVYRFMMAVRRKLR